MAPTPASTIARAQLTSMMGGPGSAPPSSASAPVHVSTHVTVPPQRRTARAIAIADAPEPRAQLHHDARPMLLEQAQHLRAVIEPALRQRD